MKLVFKLSDHMSRALLRIDGGGVRAFWAGGVA